MLHTSVTCLLISDDDRSDVDTRMNTVGLTSGWPVCSCLELNAQHYMTHAGYMQHMVCTLPQVLVGYQCSSLCTCTD